MVSEFKKAKLRKFDYAILLFTQLLLEILENKISSMEEMKIKIQDKINQIEQDKKKEVKENQ